MIKRLYNFYRSLNGLLNRIRQVTLTPIDQQSNMIRLTYQQMKATMPLRYTANLDAFNAYDYLVKQHKCTVCGVMDRVLLDKQTFSSYQRCTPKKRLAQSYSIIVRGALA